MSIRSLLLPACVVALAFTAGPAAAQSPTDNPVPGAQPGACTDTNRPSSTFTRGAARRAATGRRHVLRGTARDAGCGVDRVMIAVTRKQGRVCRHLTSAKKLGRRTSCAKRHWLPVAGTSRWSFRLPKRLEGHTYVVRTRALDFSGNLQRAHARRLKLR